MNIRDYLADIDATMLLMDGYDDCIVGVIEQSGKEPIACYDREKVIQKMVEEDGMTEEDAWDHHGYNQIRSLLINWSKVRILDGPMVYKASPLSVYPLVYHLKKHLRHSRSKILF